MQYDSMSQLRSVVSDSIALVCHTFCQTSWGSWKEIHEMTGCDENLWNYYNATFAWTIINLLLKVSGWCFKQPKKIKKHLGSIIVSYFLTGRCLVIQLLVFHGIILMSKVICKRNFMVIRSVCKMCHTLRLRVSQAVTKFCALVEQYYDCRLLDNKSEKDFFFLGCSMKMFSQIIWFERRWRDVACRW